MINQRAFFEAEKLWDYMIIGQPAVSADLLLVLGSIDDGVAAYAAELTCKHVYSVAVFSGGKAHEGDLLQTSWDATEAEHFRDVFRQSGGKAKHILLETSAENTGENATYTFELLRGSLAEIPHSIEIVTKPYMERRVKATFEAQWPDSTTQFFVTSPHVSFKDYVKSQQQFDITTNLMVGDLERIVEYPKGGLQTEQPVPNDALASWQRLVSMGYTRHLINTKLQH